VTRKAFLFILYYKLIKKIHFVFFLKHISWQWRLIFDKTFKDPKNLLRQNGKRQFDVFQKSTFSAL
jgi:hypothetical protein